MPTVNDFVAGAFLLPGEETASPFSLRSAAIQSMESLLREASAFDSETSDLAIITNLLNQRLTPVQRDNWLSSPSWAESLHAISAHNPVLRKWHEAVATPSINDVAPVAEDDAGYLGQFLLPLVLRDSPQVCGRFAVRTDLLGRIVFPDSDWRIELRQKATPPALTEHDSEPRAHKAKEGDQARDRDSQDDNTSDRILARELILVFLDPLNACFYREDGSQPCFSMPRTCLLRMLANQSSGIAYDVHQSDTTEVKLSRMSHFGSSQVRYEPAYFSNNASRESAALVGGVIDDILHSIAQFAPELHNEFCTYVHAIRGYEIPPLDGQLIGSFSDPTQPGVMNMNITFREQQPLLSPHCFTWFGHELAHTRSYLVDTLAHQSEMSFVRNRREMTPRISRYGRGFPIRTLVQIPYVHMYEWDLLMDAYQGGYFQTTDIAGLDVNSVADEIRAEIADGFQFIERYADLTKLGQRALEHQKELYRKCKRRWSRIGCGRVYFG